MVSKLEQAASSSKYMVSQTILDRAAKISLTLDWLCIPPESRIIDDETLTWVASDRNFDADFDFEGVKFGIQSKVP